METVPPKEEAANQRTGEPGLIPRNTTGLQETQKGVSGPAAKEENYKEVLPTHFEDFLEISRHQDGDKEEAANQRTVEPGLMPRNTTGLRDPEEGIRSCG
jgi:hypothetical protein